MTLSSASCSFFSVRCASSVSRCRAPGTGAAAQGAGERPPLGIALLHGDAHELAAGSLGRGGVEMGLVTWSCDEENRQVEKRRVDRSRGVVNWCAKCVGPLPIIENVGF